MELIHATVGTPAPGQCIVRAHRLVRVKFVALPLHATPESALREARIPGGRAMGIRHFVLRVIGRLVAARP